VVEAWRDGQCSRHTEESYIHRIRRFLLFRNGAHPRQLAEQDLNRVLTGVGNLHRFSPLVLRDEWKEALQQKVPARCQRARAVMQLLTLCR